MFDYEKILYDSLLTNDGSFKDKHLWCLKSTGLGVTEFMLRMMAWLCTSENHQNQHSHWAKYRPGNQINKENEGYF